MTPLCHLSKYTAIPSPKALIFLAFALSAESRTRRQICLISIKIRFPLFPTARTPGVPPAAARSARSDGCPVKDGVLPGGGLPLAKNLPGAARKRAGRKERAACRYGADAWLPQCPGCPRPSPPSGPLPPRRPTPPGHVRPGHLPARRRRLPGLFRPPRRPHSSGGNKAVSRCIKLCNCCICPSKRASQAASQAAE